MALCAGLAAIGAWYFGLIAAADGQYLGRADCLPGPFGRITWFSSSIIFRGARAFLGDAGQSSAWLSSGDPGDSTPLLYNRSIPAKLAVFDPFGWFLAVPLFDMVWVVIIRSRKGPALSISGIPNHLSHRIVRLGISPTKAVLSIWVGSGNSWRIGLRNRLGPSRGYAQAKHEKWRTGGAKRVRKRLETGANREQRNRKSCPFPALLKSVYFLKKSRVFALKNRSYLLLRVSGRIRILRTIRGCRTAGASGGCARSILRS